MGHYRVTLVAVGGHGCQREKGDRESVVGCERPNCPDCVTREYVRRLKRMGSEQVQLAQIEHWPADLGYPGDKVVVDDLLTGIRRGDFPEKEERQRQMTVPLSVIFVDTDGTSKAVPISVSGGTTVEAVINTVLGPKYGYPVGGGRRVRAFTRPEGRLYFGKPPEGEQGAAWTSAAGDEKGGSDNELTFGDGVAWRLGRPSCFGLRMEARHLPKGEPDRVAVYPYDYVHDVIAVE